MTMLFDPKSDTLAIQVTRNSDHSIQKIKYRYKGSWIEVQLGYDNTGHLVSYSIPKFMNLTHYEILTLLNMLFVQSINQVDPLPVTPV